MGTTDPRAATSEQTRAYQQILLLGNSRIKGNRGAAGSLLFPTIFEAIRTPQDITLFSDLDHVQTTQELALSTGGSNLRTKLDFLSFITAWD